MKRYVVATFSAVLAVAGIASAQTRTHTDIARAAAYRPGQDFTWIFDRLCFEPAPEPAPAPAAQRTGPPPRSVWYDEPAKVFDNLYYFVAKTESVAGGVAAYAISAPSGVEIILDSSTSRIALKRSARIAKQPSATRKSFQKRVPMCSSRVTSRKHLTVVGECAAARRAGEKTAANYANYAN
jgi:hypothetical protein